MVWTLDKAKQYGWFALKLLTLIVAVWLIIRTLSPIPTEAWQRLIRNLLSTPAWILGLLFSLSLANWGVEILKWQAAIQSIYPINFIRSARETLIAFSIGFVTPLKLGEYAVKTQFYPEIKKQKVILRQFYCHFSQLLCTLLFGLFGLMNFESTARILKFDASWIILMLGFGLFVLLLYRGNKAELKKVMELPRASILKITGLSALRMIIFSVMLLMGFQLMGSDLPWTQTIYGLWTMYLIQVIAPTFSPLDLAVKSGGALLVFQELIPAQVTLGAIVLQYFLSQMLPLIIGLILEPSDSNPQ